jgi:hypothetical protein
MNSLSQGKCYVIKGCDYVIYEVRNSYLFQTVHATPILKRTKNYDPITRTCDRINLSTDQHHTV